jgi:hypothetical protein
MLKLGLISFLIFLSAPVWAGKSNPAVKAASAVKEESLDNLICPQLGDRFVRHSETTLRSMHDLMDTLAEQRALNIDFFVTLLQLNKTNPEHEDSAGKIVDLKKGVDQKLARAKSNYNNEIKNLATSLPKAKKCWSYHASENKPKIGRFLEIFQKEPLLSEFKHCIQHIETNNKLYSQKFNLGVNFYNKITSQGTTVLEARKIDKVIDKVLSEENKKCVNFDKSSGKFYGYFEGKYDHKKSEEIVKEKPLVPSKTVIPRKTIFPENNLNLKDLKGTGF